MSAGTERAFIGWQTIANVCAGLLFAVGGYLWTDTARQLHALQDKQEQQAQAIVRLDERVNTHDRVDEDVRQQLRRLEDKLDKVLEDRRASELPVFHK